MIYIVTIYTTPHNEDKGEVSRIHRLEGVSKEYFEGFLYCIKQYVDEANIVVEKIGTEKDYKGAFDTVMCYFDSISDEEKPKLDEELNKLGL